MPIANVLCTLYHDQVSSDSLHTIVYYTLGQKVWHRKLVHSTNTPGSKMVHHFSPCRQLHQWCDPSHRNISVVDKGHLCNNNDICVPVHALVCYVITGSKGILRLTHKDVFCGIYLLECKLMSRSPDETEYS